MPRLRKGLGRRAPPQVRRGEGGGEKLTNEDKRFWIGAFLDQRDGHQCKLQSAECKGALIIDHIDGNRSNWDPSNLRWLCLGHNKREGDRRRAAADVLKGPQIGAAGRVNEGENREQGSVKRHVDYQAGSAEMGANDLMETPFMNYLEARVRASEMDPNPREGEHRVLKQDAINGGAWAMDGSPATARKYLDKATSTRGPYKVVRNTWREKVVVRRPDSERDRLGEDEA